MEEQTTTQTPSSDDGLKKIYNKNVEWGYKGTFDQFSSYFNENDDNKRKVYDFNVKNGYKGSYDDFISFAGAGQAKQQPTRYQLPTFQPYQRELDDSPASILSPTQLKIARGEIGEGDTYTLQPGEDIEAFTPLPNFTLEQTEEEKQQRKQQPKPQRQTMRDGSRMLGHNAALTRLAQDNGIATDGFENLNELGEDAMKIYALTPQGKADKQNMDNAAELAYDDFTAEYLKNGSDQDIKAQLELGRQKQLLEQENAALAKDIEAWKAHPGTEQQRNALNARISDLNKRIGAYEAAVAQSDKAQEKVNEAFQKWLENDDYYKAVAQQYEQNYEATMGDWFDRAATPLYMQMTKDEIAKMKAYLDDESLNLDHRQRTAIKRRVKDAEAWVKAAEKNGWLDKTFAGMQGKGAGIDIATMFRGMGNSLTLDRLSFGIGDALDARAIEKAMVKVRDQGVESLTPEERALLESDAVLDLTKSIFNVDESAFNAGATTMEMLPFIAELWLSGGALGAIKGGVKGAVKGGAKGFGKGLRVGWKAAMKPTASQLGRLGEAGRFAPKSVGQVAKEVGMTTAEIVDNGLFYAMTTGLGHSVANTLEYMTPEMDSKYDFGTGKMNINGVAVDEQGNIKGGDKFGIAAWKAIRMQAIEGGSEMLGEKALQPLIDRGGYWLRGMMGKQGRAMYKPYLRVVDDWIGHGVLKNVSGFGTEYAEELAGSVARVLTGLSTWDQEFNKKNLADTAYGLMPAQVAFAIIGGGRMVGHARRSSQAKDLLDKYAPEQAAFYDRVAQMSTYDGADMLDRKTLEILKTIDKKKNNGTLTEEDQRKAAAELGMIFTMQEQIYMDEASAYMEDKIGRRTYEGITSNLNKDNGMFTVYEWNHDGTTERVPVLSTKDGKATVRLWNGKKQTVDLKDLSFVGEYTPEQAMEFAQRRDEEFKDYAYRDQTTPMAGSVYYDAEGNIPIVPGKGEVNITEVADNGEVTFTTEDGTTQTMNERKFYDYMRALRDAYEVTAGQLAAWRVEADTKGKTAAENDDPQAHYGVGREARMARRALANAIGEERMTELERMDGEQLTREYMMADEKTQDLMYDWMQNRVGDSYSEAMNQRRQQAMAEWKQRIGRLPYDNGNCTTAVHNGNIVIVEDNDGQQAAIVDIQGNKSMVQSSELSNMQDNSLDSVAAQATMPQQAQLTALEQAYNGTTFQAGQEYTIGTDTNGEERKAIIVSVNEDGTISYATEYGYDKEGNPTPAARSVKMATATGFRDMTENARQQRATQEQGQREAAQQRADMGELRNGQRVTIMDGGRPVQGTVNMPYTGSQSVFTDSGKLVKFDTIDDLKKSMQDAANALQTEQQAAIEAVANRINELANAMPNARIKVVTDINELRPNTQEFAKQGRLEAYFDPSTNTVMFYAPGLVANNSNVDGKVIHEVVIHYGLRNMLGEKDYAALCLNIFNNVMDENDRAQYVQYVKDSHPDWQKTMTNAQIMAMAADEWLAFTYENRDIDSIKRESLLQTIVNFIVDLFKKAGVDLNRDEVMAELDQLVAASRDWLKGEEVKKEKKTYTFPDGTSISQGDQIEVETKEGKSVGKVAWVNDGYTNNKHIYRIHVVFEDGKHTDKYMEFEDERKKKEEKKEPVTFTGYHTPTIQGKEKQSIMTSAGLPKGYYIALDKPYEDSNHDASQARKVSVKVGKVYDPDGILGEASKSLGDELTGEISVQSQDPLAILEAQSEHFTKVLQQHGYDAYVRNIDGQEGNRELIVLDPSLVKEEKTREELIANAVQAAANFAAQGDPNFVKDNLDKAKKRVNNAKKRKPTSTDPAKRQEQIEKINTELAAAENELAFWNDVQAVINEAQLAGQTRLNEADQALQDLDGNLNPTVEAEEVHKFDKEPANADEAAADFLVGFVKKEHRINEQSLMQETGWSEDEVKNFRPATTPDGGMTLQAAAENLYNEYESEGSEHGWFKDPSEARDKLISVMQEAGKYGELANYINQRRGNDEATQQMQAVIDANAQQLGYEDAQDMHDKRMAEAQAKLEELKDEQGNLSEEALQQFKDFTQGLMIGQEETPTEQPTESIEGGEEYYQPTNEEAPFSVVAPVEAEEAAVRYSIVTDPKEIERLDNEPHEIGYRTVELSADNSFRSPMADRLGKGKGRIRNSSFAIDRWERSDENPQLADDNGKIDLENIGNVDYNPYIHIRPDAVNTQFKAAWRRPELVYVRTEYPASELTSGYKAEKAKLPVGRHDWSGGGELILSRWDKPVEVVPWEEVADHWMKEFGDEPIHFDIISPQLLPILTARGANIVAPHKNMGKACNDAYNEWKSNNPLPIDQQTPKNTTIDQVLYSIKVNHNSPYLLKKADGSFIDPETGEHLGFDHRFMNTGEGAQAHGWGSYFSADDIRRYGLPERVTIDGMWASHVLDYISLQAIERAKGNINGAIEVVKNYVKTGQLDSKVADNAIEELSKLKQDDIVYNNGHHYDVEIPDNNGTNYIEEREPATDEQINRIASAANDEEKAYFTEIPVADESISDEDVVGKLKFWREIDNSDAYQLALMFNTPTDADGGNYGKKASELLNRAGFVGIHYDGQRDGSCYVIFDENDAKIVDHVMFSVTGLITNEQGEIDNDRVTVQEAVPVEDKAGSEASRQRGDVQGVRQGDRGYNNQGQPDQRGNGTPLGRLNQVIQAVQSGQGSVSRIPSGLRQENESVPAIAAQAIAKGYFASKLARIGEAYNGASQRDERGTGRGAAQRVPELEPQDLRGIRGLDSTDRDNVRDLIKQWAKDNGYWYDEERLQSLGDELKGGTESRVFRSEDGTTISKSTNAFNYQGNVQLVIESMEMFGKVFPNTPYTIIGFSEDKNGHLCVVATQPYVQGMSLDEYAAKQGWYDEDGYIDYDRKMEHVNERMKEQYGLDLVGAYAAYENDTYHVFDVHRGNYIIDDNGDVYVIDADITLNDESDYLDNGVRFSVVTPQQDAAYMDAVNRGDMETAQRMVMEAAKAAMPNTKVVDENGNPLVVYHGTFIAKEYIDLDSGTRETIDDTPFTVFNTASDEQLGAHFGTERQAENVAQRRSIDTDWRGSEKVYAVYLNIRKPLMLADNFAWDFDHIGKQLLDKGYITKAEYTDLAPTANRDEAMKELLISKGYDGVIYWNNGFEGYGRSYIVFSPSQIKSADPVTYDDQGNVIPLSERFNESNNDIRYSVVSPQQDEAYMQAVESGDMESAQRMVDEAAREAGYISDNDFRMSHTAPNGRDGFAKSIANPEGIYPEDLYSPQGYNYYGDGDVYMDMESANIFKRLRGNPEALVKIYRAVPRSLKETKLRNGDWVTINRRYAQEHGENNIDGGYKIIEDEVPAKFVYTDGNSLHEQGYDDGKEYAYQNTKNNRKLLDPITYDDEGNVIPLSKRFNKRNGDIRYSFVGRSGAQRLDMADRAMTRLNNLHVAREMEEQGKDAKAVKMATGWERGKDGKWRYEIMDGALKESGIDKNATGLTLADVWEQPELFTAYPKMKDMELEVVEKPLGSYASTIINKYKETTEGKKALRLAKQFLRDFPTVEDYKKWLKAKRSKYQNELKKTDPKNEERVVMLQDIIDTYNQNLENAEEKYKRSQSIIDKANDISETRIELNSNYLTGEDGKIYGDTEIGDGTKYTLNSVLSHEIQHYIQELEGFAQGGNPNFAAQAVKDMDGKARIWSYRQMLDDVAKQNGLGTDTSEDEMLAAVLGYLGIDETTAEKEKWIPEKDLRHVAYNGWKKGSGMDDYKKAYDKWLEKMRESGSSNFWNGTPFELYKRLAGETEARNVQTRLGFTDEQRRQLLAAETEDVAREDQLVMFAGDPVLYSVSQAANTPQERLRLYDAMVGTKEVSSFVGRVTEGFYQSVVDGAIPLKRLQDVIAGRGKVTDAENAYLMEIARAARAKRLTDEAETKYYEPMMKAIAALTGRTSKKGYYKAMRDVELYVLAKSGLERNQWFWDEAKKSDPNAQLEDKSGLTELAAEFGEKDFTAFAERLVADYEARHGQQKIDELWKCINAVSKNILDTELDGHLISQELHDDLLNRWKFYVPMRGFDEPVTSAYYFYQPSSATIRFENPFKKIKGRVSLADNPFVNLIRMTESAINLKGKNEVGLALLNLAASHEDNGLLRVGKAWEVKEVDPATGEVTWKAAYPNLSNVSQADIPAAIDAFQKAMMRQAKTGDARPSSRTAGGVRIHPSDIDQHVLKVKVGGQTVDLYLLGNPKAFQALNPTGKSKAGEMLSGLTRSLSGLMTTYNPVFMVRNSIRDFKTAAIITYTRDGAAGMFNMMGQWFGNMNALRKLIKGESSGDATIDRYWQEFLEFGGETGFTRSLNMEKQREDFNKKMFNLTRDKSGQAMHKITHWYFDWMSQRGNRYAEDITRFAVFCASRKQGRSAMQAAADAKNTTANFNKKGQSVFARVMSNNYAFFNAAIQGLNTSFHAFKDNPGRAWKAAVSTMIYSMAIPFVNMCLLAMFGDDDDWRQYENMTQFVSNTHAVYYIPGAGFLTMPYPQDFVPFTSLGNIIWRNAAGFEKPLNGRSILGNVMLQWFDTWADLLPVNAFEEGFGEIKDWKGVARALAPTWLSPVADVMLNRNFMGSQIRRKHFTLNDQKDLAPYWAEYDRSKNWWAHDIARLIAGGDEYRAGAAWRNVDPRQLIHLVEGYGGGTVKLMSDIAVYFEEMAKGDKPTLNQAPFIKKFWIQPNPDKYEGNLNGKLYEMAKYQRELEQQIKDLQKEADKAREDGNDKAAEKREKKIEEIQNSMEYKILIDYDVNGKMKKWREERNDITNDEKLSEEGKQDKIVKLTYQKAAFLDGIWEEAFVKSNDPEAPEYKGKKSNWFSEFYRDASTEAYTHNRKEQEQEEE